MKQSEQIFSSPTKFPFYLILSNNISYAIKYFSTAFTFCTIVIKFTGYIAFLKINNGDNLQFYSHN